MDNNFNSIQLFKKKRVLDDKSNEQETKKDLPNSEQQVPELIIKPLDSSKTNSEQIPLSPIVTKIIQTVLGMLEANRKENFPLSILKNTDIRKWPIWSILRKPH